jgi:hypothetical protein
MYRESIKQINDDINRTKRVIISLGCSFVQGHGAIDESIYKNYKWEGVKYGNPNIVWDKKNTHQLVKEFPDIKLSVNGSPDFSIHELNNAFVNILAKKYFEGSYASINLGRSGCGNRAAIKELYFYPEINWKGLNEIIVIYCPSGAERFDFIDDAYHKLNEHNRWICIWPSILDNSGPNKMLWQGYKEAVHTTKFEVIEQVSHIQELMLWCEHKNAKLIIVPSFQNVYNKENFIGSISKKVERDQTNRKIIKSDSELTLDFSSAIELANMWPWDKMFTPDGNKTFIDLAMKQEFPNDDTYPWFYTYVGEGSPNLWVTPCGHPSVKAHELFAKHLHKHIQENL